MCRQDTVVIFIVCWRASIGFAGCRAFVDTMLLKPFPAGGSFKHYGLAGPAWSAKQASSSLQVYWLHMLK